MKAAVDRIQVFNGDSRDVLKTLPDNSIDACVCDPPYALVSIQKRFGKPGSAPAQHGKDGLYARASAGFMNQAWDTGEVAFDPAFWEEVRRVLKPGGYILAFGGTRSYHRLACAIEDAGFEIRDSIAYANGLDEMMARWLDTLSADQREMFFRILEQAEFGGLMAWAYGTGFPKSHDVSKGIDKRAPREGMFDAFAAHFAKQLKVSGKTQKEVAALFLSRTGGVTGCVWNWANGVNVPTQAQWNVLQPLLNLSLEWLPLIERIESEREVIGQSDATHLAVAPGQDNDRSATTLDITAPSTEAARQWQGWGTALKPAWEPIVMARKPLIGTVAENVLQHGTGAINIDGCRVETDDSLSRPFGSGGIGADQLNSIPRGTITGALTEGRWPANIIHDGSEEVVAAFPGDLKSGKPGIKWRGNEGSAYGAESRPPGTQMTGFGDTGSASRFYYSAKADKADRWGSKHPTVKPIDLMAYLVRLVTPPGGVVLDPFAGSGTTGVACLREGMGAILIEREAGFHADILERLAFYAGEAKHSAQSKNRHKPAEKTGGDGLPLFGSGKDDA